jgi:hypothetical protein
MQRAAKVHRKASVMPTIEELQTEIRARDAKILELTLKNLDLRVLDLENADIDKEKRMRTVEKSSTRFETLAWLAFGGGALSAVNIVMIFAKP